MTAPIPTPPAEAVPAAPVVPVESAPTATPPAAPPAPAPSPAAMPQQAPAPGDEGDGDDHADPVIRKMRRENQSLRTRFKEEQAAREAQGQQITDLLAKAEKAAAFEETMARLAGVFNPAAEPVDPAKLAETLAAEKLAQETAFAEQLAARDAQLRTLTVRTSLPAAFAQHQADPELTTAVLTASGALGKLDPAAPTFATDLASAVEAAVTANPRLKVAPVAARSGPEIPGRSGVTDQLTLEQVRGMKPAEVEAARASGRLKNLLGG